MSLLRTTIATCLWVLLPFSAMADTIYKFSVVPQFEVRQQFLIWQPVIEALQRISGLKFELATALSVSEYEKEVMAGRYDFIYVNPYVMPIAADNHGYVPLVRDSKPLRGILVVRKDSPIRSIHELHEKTLAVPSMTALGASLLLRAELDRQFNIKLQPLIARTHSSVFLHVINGLADAGGSVQKALAEQDPRVRDALRVLHQTIEVPSHPVAAHGRVPITVREKVIQAFLEMSKDEAGRKLLAEIPMQSAVRTRIEDYELLRTLRLDKYLTQ